MNLPLCERRWVEDGRDLGDQRLARGKARGLVAAERVLDHVDEALVAVRAGPVGAILTSLERADEIVVGDEGPRDADGVAVAATDGAGDDGCGRKAAGADHRDRGGGLAASG